MVDNISQLIKLPHLQEVLQEYGMLKGKAVRIAQILKEDEILDSQLLSES